MVSSQKKFRPPMRVLACFFLACAGAPSAALATSNTPPPFFDVTPETTSVHTDTQLNKIFLTGQGPYDDTTMKGKIFPYTLRVGGAPAPAPLYNGCYDSKNVRLGDLDAANSCAAVAAANPNRSVYRLFLGYKVYCNGLMSGPNCTNMALAMNCEYKQIQKGTGPNDAVTVPTRLCSTERGIIRSAQGSTTTTSAFVGCRPGEDGTTDPVCTKCASGTYNPAFDPNTTACLSCAANKTIPYAVASPGPTFTSVPGALSVDDCKVSGTLVCQTGYSPSPDNQSCVPGATPCTLTLGVTSSPSSPGVADGSIIANYSGQTGAVSGITITSPSARGPTSTSGSSATFNGLAGSSTGITYTVNVRDTVCSQNVNVIIKDATPTPQCSSCPAGSTLSGSNCIEAPTTTPGATIYGYTCQGAGGCTSLPCNPTCNSGQTFGQVSSTDPTPRVCDGNSLWVSFGGSCAYQSGPTTSSPSTSCPSGFTNNAGVCTMACTPTPPSSCTLTLTATGTNPTTSTSTDGKITANAGSAVGSITFTSAPSGTVTQAGTSATVTGLAAGSYMITATDAGVASCSKSVNVTLTAPVLNGLLVSGVHTTTDCTTIGGTVVYEDILTMTYKGTSGSLPADNGFCQITFPSPSSSNVCPAGWTKFRDYRATQGTYTAQAYQLKAASDPYAAHACPLPNYSAPIAKNITVEGVFVTAATATVLSGAFRNGPVGSDTVPANTYYDTECQGNTPNPPTFPITKLDRKSEFRYAAEEGIGKGFDWLFPSAFAKLACPVTETCRETTYNVTVPLDTIQIGCY